MHIPTEVLEEVLLNWLLNRFKDKSYSEVFKMIYVTSRVEESRGYQEIFQKGKEEGKETEGIEIISDLLQLKFKDQANGHPVASYLEKLGNLSLEQIRIVSKRILTCDTLEQVFEGIHL